MPRKSRGTVANRSRGQNQQVDSGKVEAALQGQANGPFAQANQRLRELAVLLTFTD